MVTTKGATMPKNPDTFNALCGNDFGGEARRRALRAIPRPVARLGGLLAPGLPARGLIGSDVSILDRRSVKAQLAGKGDFRAGWWNFNVALHRLFNPQASLESIMYAFHKRHHAVTFAVLSATHLYGSVFRTMSRRGLAAGIKTLLELGPKF